jgi:integrating conjugative element protein (TIGR03757 family)
MVGFSFGIAGLAITVLLGLGSSALATEAKCIEVFTVRDQPISGTDSLRLLPVTVRVYEIDGLQRLEPALSRGLPRATGLARGEAVRRIGELTDGQMASGREAGEGLEKVLQNGIDRYPAIVIDGATVIYGVYDLAQALNQYETWREAQSP